jgi:hypothetical protein
MSKRQAARRMSEIPPAILKQLNKGTLESGNLVEGLAVDFGILLKSVAPKLPKPLVQQMEQAYAEKLGISQRMSLAGELLHRHQGLKAFESYRQHPSDTVRGWAAYVLRHEMKLPLKKLFQLVQPLADDSHFGVREWAWQCCRHGLAVPLQQSAASPAKRHGLGVSGAITWNFSSESQSMGCLFWNRCEVIRASTFRIPSLTG